VALQRKSVWALVVGGLLVALGLAFLVSPYASSSPDGLNKVAIDKGFSDAEKESATADSPLAGYGVKGVDSEKLSTGLSGVIGVAVVFGIALLLFGIFNNRKKDEVADGQGAPQVAGNSP
jgi:hypothetical protein